MASSRDEQDLVRLLDKLRTLERTELAQCMAQVVDDMVADSIPDEIVREMCSDISQQLGISGDDIRQALH